MSCQTMTEVVLASVVFGAEEGAIFLVGLEDLLKLAGRVDVEDEAVHLVVIQKTAGIEVRASHRAETAVHHHHLVMM